MTREGVYLKRAGERWSSGYLVSWSAIYLQGAKNKAAQRIAERKAKRAQKKFLVNRGQL